MQSPIMSFQCKTHDYSLFAVPKRRTYVDGILGAKLSSKSMLSSVDSKNGLLNIMRIKMIMT